MNFGRVSHKQGKKALLPELRSGSLIDMYGHLLCFAGRQDIRAVNNIPVRPEAAIVKTIDMARDKNRLPGNVFNIKYDAGGHQGNEEKQCISSRFIGGVKAYLVLQNGPVA